MSTPMSTPTPDPTPDPTQTPARTQSLNEPEAAPDRTRRRGDRGEGVISAAIAVLIIAFLGAAMWVGFNELWTDAQDNIKTEIGKIGG